MTGRVIFALFALLALGFAAKVALEGRDPDLAANLHVLHSIGGDERGVAPVPDSPPLPESESGTGDPQPLAHEVLSGNARPTEACHELREQLAVVTAERDVLASRVAEVEESLLRQRRYTATLHRERDAVRAIEHFENSEEYEQLWSDAEREEVINLLREYPVILQPGEATFIGERVRYGDWVQYLPEGEALNDASAAIAAFGYARLQKELNPNVLRLSSLGDGFWPSR